MTLMVARNECYNAMIYTRNEKKSIAQLGIIRYHMKWIFLFLKMKFKYHNFELVFQLENMPIHMGKSSEINVN